MISLLEALIFYFGLGFVIISLLIVFVKENRLEAIMISKWNKEDTIWAIAIWPFMLVFLFLHAIYQYWTIKEG